tara:strand:- start:92 stop:499 length:408 start_codon:yes stop_codon:yes gene_type:complete
MDNPTKVLTIGIGALAAVAVYLGLKDSDETPEIIDSDIHGYDSKREELEKIRLEEVKLEKLKEEELKELKEEKLKEEKLKELRLAEEKLKEEKEKNTVEENVKMEVKEHMDKLPYESPWGTFWKSEYNDINSTNN